MNGEIKKIKRSKKEVLQLGVEREREGENQKKI